MLISLGLENGVHMGETCVDWDGLICDVEWGLELLFLVRELL
jgi:hypothetical protein